MTAPTFDGSFPHNWTAEILPNRPMILPARHYVYPALVDEVELGALEVLIQSGNPPPQVEGFSPQTQPFLATCALGFRDPATPTGIWAMPHPDWLCAASGGYVYLIDTTAPERFIHLRYRPVLQICLFPSKAADQGLILFISHHTILAWGRDGEAWESERLSAEGITGTRIEVEDGFPKLHGVGWDMMTDKDTPFTLDLRTGTRV